MTPVAELAVVGRVVPIAGRQIREQYANALIARARRGKVPGVALSHLAVRVLLFLLGQRPGYFAHQKVIAEAVESNLTSVRGALLELRNAGLVRWDLIPPHHPLPTGKYTRTNVNQYFIEAEALLRALGGDEPDTPPRTAVSTQPNSSASTGTDLRSEQDPPLPPRWQPKAITGKPSPEVQSVVSGSRERRHDGGKDGSSTGGSTREAIETVLAAWKRLNLGEPDDRSERALMNRLAEGVTIAQLLAAVDGAGASDWLRAGRAKVPFALVFASRDSVARFTAESLYRAEEKRNLAQQRADERRRMRPATTPNTLTRAEYLELATHALMACGTGRGGADLRVQ